MSDQAQENQRMSTSANELDMEPLCIKYADGTLDAHTPSRLNTIQVVCHYLQYTMIIIAVHHDHHCPRASALTAT
jgi:hypothetical protein